MRYIRRAKTAEVHEAVDKIGQGAKSYFQTEHVNSSTGAPIAKQFPDTEVLTPTTACCDQAGDKCAGGASGTWDTSSWQALHFALENNHYYQYDFTATGSDTASVFTVRAVGDLDCDGTKATWQRNAHVTGDYEVNLGGMMIDSSQEIE